MADRDDSRCIPAKLDDGGIATCVADADGTRAKTCHVSGWTCPPSSVGASSVTIACSRTWKSSSNCGPCFQRVWGTSTRNAAAHAASVLKKIETQVPGHTSRRATPGGSWTPGPKTHGRRHGRVRRLYHLYTRVRTGRQHRHTKVQSRVPSGVS